MQKELTQQTEPTQEKDLVSVASNLVVCKAELFTGAGDHGKAAGASEAALQTEPPGWRGTSVCESALRKVHGCRKETTTLLLE